MGLARLAVVDAGRLADEDAHRDDRALLDDNAFDDLRSRADEAIVLDDRWCGLQGFEHAANTSAAREMHVLTDLRTAADCGPGIDHRALTDIGADIDERRHQDDIGRDVGATADDRIGHDARAARGEVFGAEACVLRRHLVVEARIAGFDDCVVGQAK